MLALLLAPLLTAATLVVSPAGPYTSIQARRGAGGDRATEDQQRPEADPDRSEMAGPEAHESAFQIRRGTLQSSGVWHMSDFLHWPRVSAIRRRPSLCWRNVRLGVAYQTVGVANRRTSLMEVDMSTNAPLAWRPPFGFVSPHEDGDVYGVSVFASTACSNCQPNHLDVEGLQTRLRELVGSGRTVIDDYFDVYDWRSGSYCAAER
jgi:hypothetical protein